MMISFRNQTVKGQGVDSMGISFEPGTAAHYVNMKDIHPFVMGMKHYSGNVL